MAGKNDDGKTDPAQIAAKVLIVSKHIANGLNGNGKAAGK